MVKFIPRTAMDDDEFEELLKLKNAKTWREFFRSFIRSKSEAEENAIIHS